MAWLAPLLVPLAALALAMAALVALARSVPTPPAVAGTESPMPPAARLFALVLLLILLLGVTSGWLGPT